MHAHRQVWFEVTEIYHSALGSLLAPDYAPTCNLPPNQDRVVAEARLSNAIAAEPEAHHDALVTAFAAFLDQGYWPDFLGGAVRYFARAALRQCWAFVEMHLPSEVCQSPLIFPPPEGSPKDIALALVRTWWPDCGVKIWATAQAKEKLYSLTATAQ